MGPRHERTLVRRILSGDRAAAEELIRGHQPSLYAYMLRISGRPEVAEDVVQEAFVRALTNLARYDDRFRFSTWLFTIAKRLYVNAQQRLAPAFDSDAIAAAPALGWAPTGYDDRAESADRATALRMALEALSEDQREVVLLFYQLQWSVEQICEYLDVPAGTVKSHLHRARKRMRDVLEAQAESIPWLREVVA